MTSLRILLVFGFLSCCGFALIPSLSVDLLPNPKPKTFTISYSMNDSSPESVELFATTPIENVITQVGGIKTIKSISRRNSGSIEIGFDKNTDMGMKRFELATLLRNLYPKLNHEISYPILENKLIESDSKKPILIYSINGPYTSYQIKQTAREFFLKTIAQTVGVRDIQIDGVNDLQLTIEYVSSPFATESDGREKIKKAIIENSSLSYVGYVKTLAGQTFPLKSGSEIIDLTQLEDIAIIDTIGSTFLKDNAQVYWEEQKAKRYFRINGLNSITVSIYSNDQINRIALSNKLRSKISLIEQHLPKGYSIFLEHDDTDSIRVEINKNYFRLMLTLLVLIIFLAAAYRNFAQLIMLISSLIVTLLITFLLCRIFRITFHLYTIAGLSMSFGMIIDNAILILDGISKRNFKAPFQAIIGATLTTASALLLVYFLPDEERLNLTDFCTIVSIALLVSLPVSIYFVPSVYSFWSKKRNQKIVNTKGIRSSVRVLRIYDGIILFSSNHKRKLMVASVLVFGTPFFMLPTSWRDHTWYNKTFGNEYYIDNIRPILDRISGGALRIFAKHVYEHSGYREPEKTKLYVHATLPPGHSIDDMDVIIQGIESYIDNTKGIEKYITHVNSSENASITIFFDDDQKNSSMPFSLKNRLITKSLDWGGVGWTIVGVGQGFSNLSGEGPQSFKVKMIGYNYDELERQANRLASKLITNKRVKEINTNDRFDLNESNLQQPSLLLNSSTLALQGLTTHDVVNHLRNNSTQENIDLYLPVKNKWTPIVIKEKGENTANLYQTTKQPLYYSNQYFDLSNASQLTIETVTPSIRREDRQFIRVVSFEYYGNSHFGQEFLAELLKEMEAEMPVGYKAENDSHSWNWNKSKGQFGLLALMFLEIYIICVILLENLRQPLVVIATIPISFIGLFLTFGVFEFYFDQGGYAAFILLGGLTVNASIFIICELRSRPKRCITKVVFKKSVPILLTVLSTCVGLVPFLIGGQNEAFWFALSAGTIGGMLFSLIAVFFVTPILLRT